MDIRHKIRPVQLFAPSSHNPNILRLNKNTLNTVFEHASIANKKIVVISVSGAYRKGKSFLLNFFLEYLYILQYSQKNDVEMEWLTDKTQIKGFRCRNGAKRDTVGIWVWAEPIMIDTVNGDRYAMDTQGCFDQNVVSNLFANSNVNNGLGNVNNDNTTSNSNNNSNYTTLALSTMLSCIQLYNFSEYISEEAIKALKLFTNYNELSEKEAHQFGNQFQVFINFFCCGAKLLEKTLRQAIENASDEKNAAILRQIHQNIYQCFSEGVSCCLLPHPGIKCNESTTSFRLKDIKPTFRDKIKQFVEALIGPNYIKPKVINGREITVRKFVECIKEYAKLFDTPNLPTSRNILNANIQLICADFALEAKLAYCRGMDRVTRSSRMMAEKKLLEAHIKQGIKALNIFDRCPKIDSGDIQNKNLAKLQESINHELERYKRLNEEKRVTTCASAMLACGDTFLFGLGLGGAASGAVAASVVTLQMGVVSAGIVAIPVSLSALFGIWMYVTLKPTIKSCLGIERDS